MVYPQIARFENRVRQYWKNAALLLAAYPLRAILNLLIFLPSVILFIFWRGLFLRVHRCWSTSQYRRPSRVPAVCVFAYDVSFRKSAAQTAPGNGAGGTGMKQEKATPFWQRIATKTCIIILLGLMLPLSLLLAYSSS